MSESTLTGGLHGGLVAHAEGAANGWPRVPGLTGLGNQLSAALGHPVHPLLEGGECFENVVGHRETVTGVADPGQTCNHRYMEEVVRYTYRLRPGKQAVAALEAEWHRCRFLWNEAVHMSQTGQKVSLVALSRALTVVRHSAPWLAAGLQHAQEQTLRTFAQAWSDSFKVKGRGRPNYKSRKKSRPSFNIVMGKGAALRDGRLVMHKTATIPVVWHRELPSPPTSARIFQDAVGHWWVSFVTRREVEAFPESGGAIGIDWGVKTVATTTDPAFDLPASGKRRKVAAQVAAAQRRMARRYRKGQPQTNGYKSARLQAAKLHEHARNQVKHDAHVWARRVVANHALIAVEDFKPKFLAKSRMARKSADNAVGQVKRILIEKAQRAGRQVVIVPPAYTTMTCSQCGAIAKSRLDLSERTFQCECGYIADRDRNAAQTILALAEVNQASADGVSRPPETPVLVVAT